MRRTHADEPALITTAPQSSDDEFDRRKRKYAVMMSIRALCVVLAALTYQVAIWLPLLFIVGGMVLPWCAVLIANDGPPRSHSTLPPYRPEQGAERAITSGPRPTSTGEPRIVDV